MALSFVDFISQAMAQPSLFVILILVIGVTAVSGATDAPNAIATVVSTRCLKPNVAIGLAAVFNFVGLVGMTYISTAVAKTMFGMVDFSGNTDAALYALMAAMIGAILWGIFCWFFGIPCSKSHSLIAGVTGGAIALNGLAGVVPAEWAKVIYGERADDHEPHGEPVGIGGRVAEGKGNAQHGDGHELLAVLSAM